MDWMKLKSGSDVRGIAVGENAVLTAEVAQALGSAFARWVANRKGQNTNQVTIAIGRDSRISGPDLLQAAAEGVCMTGANVWDFGMCTTPAMYMSTITTGFMADGAIMITASHHPWDKNGLKFFTSESGLEGKEVEELICSAQQTKRTSEPLKGEITKRAFLPVYSDQLAERIRTGLNTKDEKPLTGLHVVVDAGNGAGGFYADLLTRLGADTTGSQFLNPDGMFPNHIPNPENADAIHALQQAVLNSGADLGVIFDTDCDRAAVCDADGREINRNRLIALISAILLEKTKKQIVVTDSVTSSGLKDFITSLGGEHYRYKRGYRNVIDEAIRLNAEGRNCPIAIETSGHAALKENHFLDDGMYLVTVLIVKAMQLKRNGQSLGCLISGLKEPAESCEIRMNITDPDFRAKGKEVIQQVTAYAEISNEWHIAPDNREGIRISFDINGQPEAGWFLLRLSVHDPVMPLNLESDVQGGNQFMLRKLYGILKDIPGIDLGNMEKAIG